MNVLPVWLSDTSTVAPSLDAIGTTMFLRSDEKTASPVLAACASWCSSRTSVSGTVSLPSRFAAATTENPSWEDTMTRPCSAVVIWTAWSTSTSKTSLMSVSLTRFMLSSRRESACAARSTAARRSRSSSRVMYPVDRATTRNKNILPIVALGSM